MTHELNILGTHVLNGMCEEVFLCCLQFAIDDATQSGAIALVSKNWHKATKHHTLWTHATLYLSRKTNFMLSILLHFHTSPLRGLKHIKCNYNGTQTQQLSPSLCAQVCIHTSLEHLELVGLDIDNDWWYTYNIDILGHGGFASLKTINLSGCTHISGHFFKILAKYTTLENVFLSGTAVDDGTIDAFSALPRLRNLGVSCTQVSFIRGLVSTSSMLEVLNLNGCRLDTLAFDNLARLVNLKDLSLSQKTPTSPSLRPLLVACNQMLILNLVGYSESTFPPDITLPCLEKLYLTGTAVSQLPTCPELRVLCLSRCASLSPTAIARLKTSLHLSVLSIDGSPLITPRVIQETMANEFSLGKPPIGLHTYQWTSMNTGGQLWWTVDGQ
jgi:hypothetical protein